MNIKGSSPVQSRQTSVTPYSHSLQRNDQFSCTTSSILSAPSTKKPFILTNTDSTDGYEMQTLSPQQKTLEAFHELEQLVPNGISGRVSIVRMSSLIQDQDDIGIETPPCKKN
ncbi:unnamed protein product [Adineta steineri]|nr:unnamed protein product [Adineta steineri]